jgi:hypothetical protein
MHSFVWWLKTPENEAHMEKILSIKDDRQVCIKNICY